MSLCQPMSGEPQGVSSQLMPRRSFSWAGVCVRPSTSKTVPETTFQGKIKSIFLAFQQELLSSQVCSGPGELRPGVWEK